MNSIRSIQQLNKRELEAGINPEGSWHTDYRDTAFIHIGGLPFELSEGDIITIFSQYGEPVWIKLARDRETGKSRGFGWLKYEDQRSCDLAVDNLGGATVMDRVLRVDHARYKPKDDEDMRDNTMGELDLDPGHESEGRESKRRRAESPSGSDEDRPLLPEEIELDKLERDLDEDDPMKRNLVAEQQEKVKAAIDKFKKRTRKEKRREKERDRERRHRRHRSRDRDKEHKRITARDESEGGRARGSSRHRGDSRDREHRPRRSDSREGKHRHHRDRSRDEQVRERDWDRERRRRYSSDEGDDGRIRGKHSWRHSNSRESRKAH